MTREEFFYLVDKHLNGLTTDQEKQQLLNFTQSFQQGGWDYATLGDPDDLQKALYEKLKSSLQGLNQQEDPAGIRRLGRGRIIPFIRRWGWAAASVIALLIIGSYLWNPNRQADPELARVEEPQATPDIPPGTNKAVLTLADGRIVMLDENFQGQIASQAGVDILNVEGKVVYGALKSTEDAAIATNTMTTPRGGQYQLALPDGTRVWLNAASSITFPVVFAPGKKREVTIRGEAYFEVARDPSRPFVVGVVSQLTGEKLTEVEVLGTSFNINAYDNEPWISTTLLEGSIKTGGQVLKPGQALTNGKVHEADVDKVMAWKNGVFNFDDADLPSVLRQISRWYDVDVEYPQGVPDRIFGGKVERSLTLSQVLLILERMEVQFEVTRDKKLIVLPGSAKK